MVTFNYNEEKGYVETMFIDVVNQGEIVNYLHALRQSEIYPKNLKILIDDTQGILSLKPHQLNEILNENIRLFERYESLNVAIVTDRPVDTALAVIYTRLIQLERYKFQVFNTKMAADLWLNKGMGKNPHHIVSNDGYKNNLVN